MRQSRTAGRIPGGARRLAVTSLGTGFAVMAAAPLASAATGADAVLPASSTLAGTASASAAATAAAWARLGSVRLYPLAGTGIDPLSNVVGTSVGGIPISTQPVTDTVSDGLPISDLPVVGRLFA